MAAPAASRVAYWNDYSSDAGADEGKDCSGHGTNVASIATGYNDGAGAPALEDANGFNHGLGVAPFALVGASKIFNCAGGFAGGWTPATLAGERVRRRRAHLQQLVGHERAGLLGRLLHPCPAVRRGGT